MVRDITFAKTSEDKLTFTFLVHDRRLDKMQCTAATLDHIEEDKPSIRRCIDGVSPRRLTTQHAHS